MITSNRATYSWGLLACCVSMVLQPRKFRYKLRQKQRALNYNFRSKHQLSFGQVGLTLTKPLRINSKKMFRLGLFLKKSARRGDKTLRKTWVNTFPHIPMTKKVIGSRMGKGKGKLSIWYNQLTAGIIFIEMKNLRLGRACYYLRQARNKLKGSAKVIYRYGGKHLIRLCVGRRSTSYQSIW